MQFQGKVAPYSLRQRDAFSSTISRCLVYLVALAHYDLEPTLPIPHHPEHLFVLRGCNVGKVQVNGLLDPFGQAADAVDAAGALLERGGVPA